jgi:lysophospholipase L1-like esterase
MDSTTGRTRILVLTDSLAFYGPRMPHRIDEPRLWPNLMAGLLDAEVEVFGDFSWTARHCWYALGHDPWLWAGVSRADLVVLAVGSFDTTPAPLPHVLWKLIALIRNSRARRLAYMVQVRTLPRLAKLFAHLPRGGPVALSPRVSLYYLRASLMLIRRRRRGVPVVGMTPLKGAPKIYGGVQPGWAAGERMMRLWAADADVPLLDTMSVLGAHMASDLCNEDGMHLGWEGHELMASAAARLCERALGRRPADELVDDRSASPAPGPGELGVRTSA